MTRKQHKRRDISKLHKSRENSREMLFDVSYKSDIMTTNGRRCRCPKYRTQTSTLLRTKVVQRWCVAAAPWWRGEVNICGRKNLSPLENIFDKMC